MKTCVPNRIKYHNGNIYMLYGTYIKIICSDKEITRIRIKNPLDIVFLKGWFYVVSTRSLIHKINYDFSIECKIFVDGDICSIYTNLSENAVYLSAIDIANRKTYLIKIINDKSIKIGIDNYSYVSICGINKCKLKTIERNMDDETSNVSFYDIVDLSKKSSEKFEKEIGQFINLDEKLGYCDCGLYDYIDDKLYSFSDLKMDANYIIYAKKLNNVYYVFCGKRAYFFDENLKIISSIEKTEIEHYVIDALLLDDKKYYLTSSGVVIE